MPRFFIWEIELKNLQEATEKICELKGSVLALDALVTALIRQMPAQLRESLGAEFERNIEIARTVLLHAPISDHTITAFDLRVDTLSALIASA